MKVQFKIPNGWKRLRTGITVKKGDRYNSTKNLWIPIHISLIGYIVGSCIIQGYIENVYIRKVKK